MTDPDVIDDPPSHIVTWLGYDTTGGIEAGLSHNGPEHLVIAGRSGVVCGDIVYRTSFKMYFESELRLTGLVRVHYLVAQPPPT